MTIERLNTRIDSTQNLNCRAKFNIIVNDINDVIKHVPTKYQFVGNPIRNLRTVTYMSSSAPDTIVKVSVARSTHG